MTPTALLVFVVTMFFAAGTAFGMTLAYAFFGEAMRVASAVTKPARTTPPMHRDDSTDSFVMPTMSASLPMFLAPLDAARGPLTEILLTSADETIELVY